MKFIFKIWKKICNKRKYKRDLKLYNKLNYNDDKFIIDKKLLRPCYNWNTDAGTLDEHYFLQDIYMASYVIKNHPIKHYDIGSRIDGFIAHLLSTMEVTMIDIRPLPFNISGLHFLRGNATSLDNIQDNSIVSLSSLHALEHFGLGRYGDPIDPFAWKKALGEMERVLKPGGILYLSVPIGNKECVYFNAHRIFNPITIVEELKNMRLEKFSFISNMRITDTVSDNLLNYDYGNYSCGLFIFSKL